MELSEIKSKLSDLERWIRADLSSGETSEVALAYQLLDLININETLAEQLKSTDLAADGAHQRLDRIKK